jgi:hypothetical protein
MAEGHDFSTAAVDLQHSSVSPPLIDNHTHRMSPDEFPFGDRSVHEYITTPITQAISPTPTEDT